MKETIEFYMKGSNVQLSKNFDLKEFECKCKNPDCMYVLVDRSQIERLQRLRDDLGVAITINSGFRCQKHNEKVGGAKNSQHMLGTATDIAINNMKLSDVYEKAKNFGFMGLGIYNTFIHLDSRDASTAAVWDNRSDTTNVA